MNLKKRWISLIDILYATVKYLCWFLIKFYQVTISPQTGSVCRFYPTCSAYAEESFRIYNPITAFTLTLKRILRCRPGGPFGHDPVPRCGRMNG